MGNRRPLVPTIDEATATILAKGWAEVSNEQDGSHQLLFDEVWARNVLPAVREFMHRVRTGKEGSVKAHIGPARKPPSMDRKGHLVGLRGQMEVSKGPQEGDVLFDLNGRAGAHLHPRLQAVVDGWDAEDTIA